MGTKEDEEAAAREQARVRADMDRALGKNTSNEPTKFPWWKKITDNFTLKGTQETDWVKVGIGGLGGVIGAVLAADTGIAGMGVAAIVGSIVTGAAGIFLMDWIRSDNKTPKSTPPPLYRPGEPKENEKVIARRQGVFPAVDTVKAPALTVDIPTYDKIENPTAPATQKQIEEWRKVVALGNPDSRDSQFADNWLARQMLKELESAANQQEINLRYLRDALPEQSKGPAAQMNGYLQHFGPEAQQYLSVGIDPLLAKHGVDMSKVPGRYGKLTLPPEFGRSSDELEEYGKQIKAALLADMKKLRAGKPADHELAPDEQMFDKAWDSLNVIGKRNLISNFAAKAIYDTMRNPTDWRNFFPEDHSSLDSMLKDSLVQDKAQKWAGVKLNGDSDVYFSFRNTFIREPAVALGIADPRPSQRYIDAYKRNDMETMAKILEERLKKDNEERAALNGAPVTSNMLRDEDRFRMQTFIMGFRAYNKQLVLQRYIDEVVVKQEIPALEKYENAMLEHNWHVDRVRKRFAAYEQGGKKFLTLDEGPVAGTAQTFKILDTRTSTPKTLTVEVTYETAPVPDQPRTIRTLKINGEDKTAAIANRVIEAGDVLRLHTLSQILDQPGMVPLPAAPTLQQLGESQRGTTTLPYTDPTQQGGEAPKMPESWRMPLNPDLGTGRQ